MIRAEPSAIGAKFVSKRQPKLSVPVVDSAGDGFLGRLFTVQIKPRKAGPIAGINHVGQTGGRLFFLCAQGRDAVVAGVERAQTKVVLVGLLAKREVPLGAVFGKRDDPRRAFLFNIGGSDPGFDGDFSGAPNCSAEFMRQLNRANLRWLLQLKAVFAPTDGRWFGDAKIERLVDSGSVLNPTAAARAKIIKGLQSSASSRFRFQIGCARKTKQTKEQSQKMRIECNGPHSGFWH